MKRPLLAVCIGLVAGMALRLMMSGAPPKGEVPGLQEGEVTVTGTVYRKDTNYFYLKSVSVLETDPISKFPVIRESAATQQQKNPQKYYFLCEYQGDTPAIGSNVVLQGELVFFAAAGNPGEFDAAKYYRTQRLNGKITDIVWLQPGEDYSRWREWLYETKEYFKARLYRIFPEKEASVMTAMLLGDKSDLDADVKRLYQDNGIIHILSISGLHITLIGMSIYRFLRKIGLPVWLAAFLGSTILLLYGVMTGMSTSACRAIGMFLIRMLAQLCGRTYDMMTALGVMAAGMAVMNPGNLENAGYLLSFGAIAGIGCLYPALSGEDGNGQQEKEEAKKEPVYVEKGWKGYLLLRGKKWLSSLGESFLAALSVTLATLPVQLWFYYEVPVYSVFLNLLVLPLMTYVMFAGILAMLIPGMGILGTIDCVILAGYEKLCLLAEKLPFSMWNPGKPQLWQVAVYYSVMVLVVCWRAKRLRIHRLKPLILGVSILLFALPWPVRTTVTFLDVGQGDGICMQMASGEVYLFDCGSTSRKQVGEYVLKPYLKYHGISHVDAVFVSHDDSDHCSGLVELVEKQKDWGISVGRIVLSGNTLQQPFAEIAANSRTEFQMIKAGDRIAGKSFVIECLHPSGEGDMAGNAGSQCFWVTFPRGISLILTGDVEGEGEKVLLRELEQREKEDVTVLKVAHHGSAHSSSKEILAQLSPQVAIISCGMNNSYGHPHAETLQRLKEEGCKIVTTPEYGAVTITIGREAKLQGYKR